MDNSEERLRIIYSHVNIKKKPAVSLHNLPKFNPVSSYHIQCKFTLDNSHLTDVQRQFYEENGFILIRNLVAHEKIEKYRLRFLDIIEGHVPSYGMTKMKDVSLKELKGVSPERIYNKIQDFVWDDVLSEYFMLPEMILDWKGKGDIGFSSLPNFMYVETILDYVGCFTGPNIMAMHTMLINKPPDPGTNTSRHPLHQDLYYFPFRPADRIVGAWTAMEKIDESNGCLFVVPGSHKGKLEEHVYPQWVNGVNKLYHGVRGFDELPRAILEMEKGDTVFFHPLLLHGSGPNKTQRFRKAISCHYASSECHYINVKGTVQENIANEVDEVLIKRGFEPTDYVNVWKGRSRLVRGKMISLK